MKRLVSMAGLAVCMLSPASATEEPCSGSVLVAQGVLDDVTVIKPSPKNIDTPQSFTPGGIHITFNYKLKRACYEVFTQRQDVKIIVPKPETEMCFSFDRKDENKKNLNKAFRITIKLDDGRVIRALNEINEVAAHAFYNYAGLTYCRNVPRPDSI